MSAASPTGVGQVRGGAEVPRAVLFKLYIHTALMITLPIATYFLSASYYFQGDNNTTKAAIASAAIANLVVISFIISAFMEDTETVRKKKE